MQQHQVDIIPYGDLAEQGIVEPTEEITLDVTGMAESAAHAVTVTAEGQQIRLPTLASMIALKMVAWGYRGETTNKDARDLGPLLDPPTTAPSPMNCGRTRKAGQRWEYDDILMGPYRAGLEVRDTWNPASITRLRSYLAGDKQETLASRHGGGPFARRLEQLVAFEQGLSGRRSQCP